MTSVLGIPILHKDSHWPNQDRVHPGFTTECQNVHPENEAGPPPPNRLRPRVHTRSLVDGTWLRQRFAGEIATPFTCWMCFNWVNNTFELLHLPGSSKDLELNILVWRCMRCTYYLHDNVTIQKYSLDCRLPNHTATTETRTISQSVSSGPSANSQGGCTPSYVWLNPNCSWLNRNDLAIYELQLVKPFVTISWF
jgi:hypothetical protein